MRAALKRATRWLRLKIDVWLLKREIALVQKVATQIRDSAPAIELPPGMRIERLNEEREAEMRDVQECLRALGRAVEDKVTGFVGVVETVAFDLYGCVQAIIRPQVGANNEFPEGKWIDFDRLEFLDGDPVMPQPSFVMQGGIADKGPADKPAPASKPAR